MVKGVFNKSTYIGEIIYNFYNMFSFNPEGVALLSADAISDDEAYLMSTILDSDESEKIVAFQNKNV
ncbi:hypothetical protein KFZ58_15245 [Virgibacillus sp. NKC19-16]|uniref:hypothetical protein n=1 Tax=Virgibacillus salidurans TaxID=2831673 RepID=UPI001F2570F7|nr:hypothetical protein [Virgibacillus sp. NKC19-16]UJL45727.1 hypothetical protein KFZ58_15245 [Virgibacillus sp. NKC19-16]